MQGHFEINFIAFPDYYFGKLTEKKWEIPHNTGLNFFTPLSHWLTSNIEIMAKKKMKIDALNAFRIAAILKTAKPRQKDLKDSLLFAQNSLASILTATDVQNAKETISEAVTEAILETVNFPPPVAPAQPLAAMGYTNPTYSVLAGKMTIIVRHYQSTETVLRSEVIKAKTVGGCITLAIKKTKL